MLLTKKYLTAALYSPFIVLTKRAASSVELFFPSEALLVVVASFQFRGWVRGKVADLHSNKVTHQESDHVWSNIDESQKQTAYCLASCEPWHLKTERFAQGRHLKSLLLQSDHELW